MATAELHQADQHVCAGTRVVRAALGHQAAAARIPLVTAATADAAAGAAAPTACATASTADATANAAAAAATAAAAAATVRLERVQTDEAQVVAATGISRREGGRFCIATRGGAPVLGVATTAAAATTTTPASGVGRRPPHPRGGPKCGALVALAHNHTDGEAAELRLGQPAGDVALLQLQQLLVAEGEGKVRVPHPPAPAAGIVCPVAQAATSSPPAAAAAAAIPIRTSHDAAVAAAGTPAAAPSRSPQRQQTGQPRAAAAAAARRILFPTVVARAKDAQACVPANVTKAAHPAPHKDPTASASSAYRVARIRGGGRGGRGSGTCAAAPTISTAHAPMDNTAIAVTASCRRRCRGGLHVTPPKRSQ